jgi:bla regulator protein BlaR1
MRDPMLRGVLVTLIGVGFVAGAPAHGQVVQASGPLPSFEVATIKPNHGGPLPPLMSLPNVFRNFNVTARDLVRVAYGLPPSIATTRVFGGPAWIDNNRYDVDGKIPDAVFAEIQKSQKLRREQMLLMVQSLLAERFKLVAHVETREMPIYELVVAKSGPKLTLAKPAQPGDDAPPPPPAPGAMPKPGDMRQGLMVLPKTRNVMEMTAKGQTLDALAQMPFFGLGVPVVNKTGLTARYDFTLDWTPDPGAAATNAADAPAEVEAPSVYTALEEQLGLKLVSTKGPVEVIVIDHIELPSEN